MRFPVFRTVQQGVTLYIGKMSVATLLDKCVITEWDPNLGWDLARQGYQRAPIAQHYRRIANFLANEGDPLLPTAALLSARENDYGQISFEEATPGSGLDFGWIDVPDGRQLFIVDYQHRWRGFKTAIEEMGKSSLGEFQVPFILMANATRYKEMRQFYLINDKQRRVDTDLALALLMTMAPSAAEPELYNLVGPGKRYRIRATRLTFNIAALTAGAWVKKIQEPNNPQPTDLIAPKSFVDSLRPVISNRSPVYRRPDAELVGIIGSYWDGISRLMPTAFQNPRAFAIQKALGVFVMHRVAAGNVFRRCAMNNDFSPQNITNILQPAVSDYLNENFWRTGGSIAAYSSASGHRVLAQLIMAKLP